MTRAPLLTELIVCVAGFCGFVIKLVTVLPYLQH